MLSFGNSLFLAALAGLAIPILLHLINRELAVNLKFPSIRFINRAELPRREKRKLRDILLLVLRLLLFSAVVFAFSKPAWVQPAAEVAAGSTQKQTLYLVDASSSLARGNSWNQARQLVSNDLRNADAGQAGLVVYADRVIAQVQPTANFDSLEDTLADLEPAYTAGNPGPAIDTAVRLFQPEAEKRLVIVSDFQETDWQRDLPGVPEEVELTFLHPEEGSGNNVGIVNVNTVPLGRDQARVLVTLRNYGTETVTVPVSLNGEGLSDSSEVEIPAGKQANLSFTLEVENALSMTANIPADVYNRDNAWHFWIAPPPVVRVYAFLPNLDEPQAANAFYFLQTALEVESENDWVRFEVTALDRGFFEASLLKEADVVILPASGAYFRDDNWEDLKEFLNLGRTAILLPGESFPRHFRALETHEIMQSRFLGLAGNTNERQKPYHLHSINPSSRLARTFADAAGKDLLLVNVYRYVRLQPDPADTVIMSFDNGEPALLRLSVGSGTVFASTFAFDPSWTDLPLRNSFLPLIRELVQEGFNTDRLRRKIFVEDVPFAREAAVPATLEQEGQFWEININPSESVTATVDVEQWLPALLSNKPLYAGTNAGAQVFTGSEGTRTELWPWLLMVALHCIMLESLITGMSDPVQHSSFKKPNPA
ncbi:MAG: VWA domain-containing protein [Verrucomicrobiae bacterium]|nr:VWA domain-containing protein [Verrucomicrobiae bacterium]